MTFTSEPGTGGPTDPAERLWNGRGHVERLRHEFQSSERSTMAATFRKRSAGFVGQRFGGVEFSPAVEGSGAMMNFNAAVGRLSALAPLILRLAIGGVMAYHGIQKLTGGLAGVEEMFRMFQVPAPAASAVAVTAIEIIAGFALLLAGPSPFAFEGFRRGS